MRRQHTLLTKKHKELVWVEGNKDVAASAVGIPKGKVSIDRKPRETNLWFAMQQSFNL